MKWHSWIGWIVAAVLALLHIKRTRGVTVEPGEVTAPHEQDQSGTLPAEEIDKMRRDIDAAMKKVKL